MYFASVFLDGVWYIYVFVLPSNVLTTNSGALCVSTSQWQTIYGLSHTLSDDCSSVVDMFLQTWLATCSPAGFVSAICLTECSTDQCKHQAVPCDLCLCWLDCDYSSWLLSASAGSGWTNSLLGWDEERENSRWDLTEIQFKTKVTSRSCLPPAATAHWHIIIYFYSHLT